MKQETKEKYPYWMEIDVSKLISNYHRLTEHLGSNIGIMPVVKCNAYGHGLIPITEAFVDLGVEKISVSDVDEAIQIRKINPEIPLFILYPQLPSRTEEIVKYSLETTVDDYGIAAELNSIAEANNKKIKIHIQINTGLNIYGINTNEVLSFFQKIKDLPNLQIEGVWMHHSIIEEGNAIAKKELSLFIAALDEIASLDISPKYIHVASSSSIITFPESHSIDILLKSMPESRIIVRTGSLLYGIIGKEIGMQPILDSIKSKVLEISILQKDNYIGYFKHFKLSKTTNIAHLPIGWGNSGYNPENATMKHEDTYLKGVSITSSNHTAIDVTSKSAIKAGSIIHLMKNGDPLINIDNLALEHKTFVHNLISSFGEKIHKIYIK